MKAQIQYQVIKCYPILSLQKFADYYATAEMTMIQYEDNGPNQT